MIGPRAPNAPGRAGGPRRTAALVVLVAWAAAAVIVAACADFGTSPESPAGDAGVVDDTGALVVDASGPTEVDAASVAWIDLLDGSGDFEHAGLCSSLATFATSAKPRVLAGRHAGPRGRRGGHRHVRVGRWRAGRPLRRGCVDIDDMTLTLDP